MQLYSNASLVGFGVIFKQQWPKEILSVEDSDLSMAFRELYPIVAAAVLWGKELDCKTDTICMIICQQYTFYKKAVPHVWPL